MDTEAMYRKKTIRPLTLAFVVGLLTLAVPASASISFADFHESEDLPDFGSLGPNVELNAHVPLPSASPQLSLANSISNPDGFTDSLLVSFDPTTNNLSLTADTVDDTYEVISIRLDNINFTSAQFVSAFAPVSTGNAVFDSGGNPFTITTSFGSNFIVVTYQVNTPGTLFDITNAGTDVYHLSLAPVPEPGTFGIAAMGLMGLAALAFSRRRRAALTVSK
jgi:MYXO-CTERM domain-containing protein